MSSWDNDNTMGEKQCSSSFDNTTDEAFVTITVTNEHGTLELTLESNESGFSLNLDFSYRKCEINLFKWFHHFITSNSLISIILKTNLRYLRIKKYKYDLKSDTDGIYFASALKSLRVLDTLVISRSDLDEELGLIAEAIIDHPTLENMKFYFNEMDHDYSPWIDYFIEKCHLKTFYITGLCVTSYFFDAISKNDTLTSINMENVSTDPDGLKACYRLLRNRTLDFKLIIPKLYVNSYEYETVSEDDKSDEDDDQSYAYKIENFPGNSCIGVRI